MVDAALEADGDGPLPGAALAHPHPQAQATHSFTNKLQTKPPYLPVVLGDAVVVDLALEADGDGPLPGAALAHPHPQAQATHSFTNKLQTKPPYLPVVLGDAVVVDLALEADGDGPLPGAALALSHQEACRTCAPTHTFGKKKKPDQAPLTFPSSSVMR